VPLRGNERNRSISGVTADQIANAFSNASRASRFFEAVPDVELKDDQRLFTHEQRLAIYRRWRSLQDWSKVPRSEMRRGQLGRRSHPGAVARGQDDGREGAGRLHRLQLGEKRLAARGCSRSVSEKPVSRLSSVWGIALLAAWVYALHGPQEAQPHASDLNPRGSAETETVLGEETVRRALQKRISGAFRLYRESLLCIGTSSAKPSGLL
jgi:hypothetical protein